jgi:tRNA-splicing ligase RtcB
VGAIIPAAVGVDIGCGMMAQRTTLRAKDLPDNLFQIRNDIERAVPHGTSKGKRDKGSWGNPPELINKRWGELATDFDRLCEKYPVFKDTNNRSHLGTLGTGNHFIELCLDEEDTVWVMLHSGSRGVGNRIGQYFIELAKKDMEKWMIHLPDKNLAYFPDGTEHFDDYCSAIAWAQRFALTNREVMMERVIVALKRTANLPDFELAEKAVNCHHNYVSREFHFDENVLVTRKGAVKAGAGDLGIIPGSMGAKSFIVRGKGNPLSFHSCSHGAGRMMSRTEAFKRFSIEDHAAATAGVECRKDKNVIDETPAAYKDIDAVMTAQSELVDIVHTLKQVVCVKG